MNSNSEEQPIRRSIFNSIEKEELLIKKYNDYQDSTESKEWKNMLTEFKKNAKEHIDLLKNKLQNFNS
jgi:hypothetical protein